MLKGNRVQGYLLSALLLGNFKHSLSNLHSETAFTITYKCLIVNASCAYDNFGRIGGRVKCASLCGISETCAAFKYYPGDTNCVSLHKGCLEYNTACPRSDADLQVFEKQILSLSCQNGGTWDAPLQICKCVNYWVGRFCERRPYSCGDLYRYWYAAQPYQNVPIDIFRNGSRIVEVVCWIGPSTSSAYIFANTGTLDHNKTWQEYVNGYFMDNVNFWLGLENAVAFNRMGQDSVGFILVLRASATDTKFWSYQHSDFIIQDASNGYRITSKLLLPNTFGNLKYDYVMADLLSMSQGVPFSAPDWDRDNDADHCASKAGRGWWFDTCNPAKDMNTSINPLGWNYRVYPGLPTDQHIWIPGVDMTNQSVVDNFQSCAMYFVETNPRQL